MTEKLYDLNSYVTECDAEVLSCEKAKKNGIEGFAVSLSCATNHWRLAFRFMLLSTLLPDLPICRFTAANTFFLVSS